MGIYEKFRVGANFENIIGDIKYPCNEKRRLRKTKPFIELQFIVTRYNENEVEDILKLAEGMRVDRLHFKSLYLCSHFYDIDERKRLTEEYLPKRKDVKIGMKLMMASQSVSGVLQLVRIGEREA